MTATRITHAPVEVVETPTPGTRLTFAALEVLMMVKGNILLTHAPLEVVYEVAYEAPPSSATPKMRVIIAG